MQTALAHRFAGLGPRDLPDGVRIASTDPSARLPPALAELWVDAAWEGPRLDMVLPDQLLEATSLMVVACDVFDQGEAAALAQLLSFLDTNESGPPVALLPMRRQVPEGGSSASGLFQALRELREPFGTCVDDVVCGRPAGFGLALAIRASLAKVEAKVDMWMGRFRHRSFRAVERRALKDTMDATLWQYVPQRLHIALPPIDRGLGDEDGRHFAGYAVGQRLSSGADELVFEVEPPPGVPVRPGGEMVKIIPKATVHKNIDAIRRVQRTWQIMQSLSGRWSHPNIARSYQIYHSPTHIYIRMEHGGSESLYHRLKARGQGTRSLSTAQLQSVVAQMAAVVNHLHVGPRICHRDIKPENIALTGAPSDEGPITVKLVNFDTVAVQRPGGKCKLKSGTFPFVAPEVAGHRYDGMAADMWSMGILFLEVACGIRIVERCVLEGVPEGQGAIEVPAKGFPRRAVERVRQAFAEGSLVGEILASRSVPELESIRPWYETAVRGLVHAEPANRWTSEHLAEAVQAVAGTDGQATEAAL